MAKHRTSLTHRRQRSILTDMLPFEVPPTFSNRGFYTFLKKHRVEIEDGQVQWVAESDHLDSTIRLLFGVQSTPSVTVAEQSLSEWGKVFKRRSVPLSKCELGTIPFNFGVAHKLEGRTLSVVHPRNQVCVASFYADYSALITYYCSLSEFSIRRPVSVARYSFYKDKLHELRLEPDAQGIEIDAHEYEQLGSYFVYRKYQNIHRFFESYEYHRSEKKYNAMMQIDVSKCFDSIYTHSIAWSVLGKPQAKRHMEEQKNTFGGKFDSLMQLLNHRETNGIVIGPEFSRIFAEVILQSVDVEVQQHLHIDSGKEHRVDFAMFRYVDDYFVFYNDAQDRDDIAQIVQAALKEKKLSINAAKIKHYEKPIITELTVAKEQISALLNADVDPSIEENPRESETDPITYSLNCSINSNRLIVRYKTVIKESAVGYGDILNYTLSILEKKIEKTLKLYSKTRKDAKDTHKLIKAQLAIFEFAFFIYSSSPKVNHSVRLCRLITTCVTFLNKSDIAFELKHQVFKYVHDNIVQQLEKNMVGVHREVESHYLLIALSQVGKEYWMPESLLLKHFDIEVDSATGEYKRKRYLNHFSITVILSYIQKKVRYQKLRAFIEMHAVGKLTSIAADFKIDAEGFMLFMDLLVCPYISTATKSSMGVALGLSTADLAGIGSSHDRWFTAWGDKFDAGRELDAKRSREVY